MDFNFSSFDISSWGKLWDHTTHIWKNGVYGVDIAQIITALGIFILFMIIRGLFTKFVLERLRGWTAKTQTRIDDKIVDALIPPIRFIPVIMGLFFALEYIDLPAEINSFVDNIIRTLITFTIFWGLFRTLSPLSNGLENLRSMLSHVMVDWLFKLLKVITIFLGAAVILELWGIEIGPLLAGLGLFGAAIALGAQDVFKNMFGGLSIIIEKRFNPGEWIKVDGVVEGIVEKVGFRSTTIRRFDKAPVHVPNSQLSDVAITNFSRMTYRRIYWMIGVEYKTTKEQLEIIVNRLREYIESEDDFVKEEGLATFVHVDSFNSSSIDIMLYCFTKTKIWGEWLAIKEKLAFKVKDIVENEAGTGFAFPSRTIYVEYNQDDQAETFHPPKERSPGESGKVKP
tara:strand:- start:456 stop:1649 length:1194 start_codon:yes stop_codon:yes gene_type:complete